MAARVKRTLWAVLLVLLAAGCAKGPGSEPGPKHKWFNPHGQPAEDVIPAACDKDEHPRTADMAKPPVPPVDKVPAGWRRATYLLRVDAIKVVGDFQHSVQPPVADITYCIPVSLFVYISGAGIPVQVVEMDREGVETHPVPWNGLRDTPWQAIVDVYWDPHSTAPVMNFELSAKYEVGSELSKAAAPTDGRVGLMCRITQEGVTLSMGMSLDVFGPTRQVDVFGARAEYVTGPFVRCNPPAFSALAR